MTTRKAGGMHQPYKGMLLAAPQGAPKRSADRKPFSSSLTNRGCSYCLQKISPIALQLQSVRYLTISHFHILSFTVFSI